MFSTGANEHMQSNNLDDELIALNFKAQNRVKSVYDVNATFGGPVKRDRVWFFSTYRRWSANNFLGNTFSSTGEQAIDDQHITDATIRVTTIGSSLGRPSAIVMGRLLRVGAHVTF